nr:sugar phosphate isomerase/epimerase family protein [Halomonas socia]
MPLSFAEQCHFAASIGYDGLEVAPYTLADDPLTLSDVELHGYRRMAADAGVTISGLHWLLVAPAGLSIVDADHAVRRRTLDAMRRLVEVCAELGGGVLVHGSPRQRMLGEDAEGDRDRAQAYFALAGEVAAEAGVTYCVEPLAVAETNFITTLDEAAALVREVNSPGLKTMLDTSAAANGERRSVVALLDEWLPSGLIAHLQLNDRNRRAPGQGEDRFAPILDVLRRHGWNRPIAVEPFIYEPDGLATAARAIGYLRGIEEALA